MSPAQPCKRQFTQNVGIRLPLAFRTEHLLAKIRNIWNTVPFGTDTQVAVLIYTTACMKGFRYILTLSSRHNADGFLFVRGKFRKKIRHVQRTQTGLSIFAFPIAGFPRPFSSMPALWTSISFACVSPAASSKP